MADESQTNIAVFLQNIPSLISEARRRYLVKILTSLNSYNDKLRTVCKQVLNIFLNRSQGRGCDNQLQENTGTLLSELQCSQESYER